jgi:hypothetical protein
MKLEHDIIHFLPLLPSIYCIYGFYVCFYYKLGLFLRIYKLKDDEVKL